jgi:hypothetical protein
LLTLIAEELNMKRRLLMGCMMVVGTIGILACNAAGTATVTPVPTVTSTNLPEPTTAPTIIEPTAAPATKAPTLSSPTTAPATLAPTSAGVDRIKIYLVAMDDKGISGDMIGCEDSIIPVDRQIARTQAPLRAALEELLTLTDQFYGESGLYNALYNSHLTVDDVTIDANGKAMVYLEGTLLSAGTCDDPRIIAQLTYTARQFSTVKDAAIYVNGTLVQELLSTK